MLAQWPAHVHLYRPLASGKIPFDLILDIDIKHKSQNPYTLIAALARNNMHTSYQNLAASFLLEQSGRKINIIIISKWWNSVSNWVGTIRRHQLATYINIKFNKQYEYKDGAKPSLHYTWLLRVDINIKLCTLWEDKSGKLNPESSPKSISDKSKLAESALFFSVTPLMKDMPPENPGGHVSRSTLYYTY